MLTDKISSLLSKGINSILIFLIVFSPLFYGSVTLIGYTIIEIAIFLLVMLWFFSMVLTSKFFFLKTKLLFPAIALVTLVILQIIPLPFIFLRFISPKTAYFYKEFLPSDVTLYSFFSISVSVGSTIDALSKLICYFLIFFFIINYLQTKKQFQLFLNTIIISGVFISMFGIIQKISYGYLGKVYWFDLKSSAPSCFGPFVNRNHFAGYVEMVIPICLGYLVSDISIKIKIFYALGIFIMSIALFLSLSRAGMVIYILSLGIIILFLLIKQRKFEYFTITSLFLLILIFLISQMDFKAILNRFFSVFEDKSGYILERGYRFSDILKLFLDMPFFGSGLGTFSKIAPFYKSTNIQMVILHAHNDYLQLLAEVGIFGIFFIVLFFYFYFSSLFKMWFKRHDRFVIGLGLGGLVSVFAIFIHSFVDFNLRIPANALLFFIILGINYKLVFTGFRREGIYHFKIWQKEISLRQKRIFIFLVLLIFLFIEISFLMKIKAENLNNQAKKYLCQLEQLDKELFIQRSSLYKKIIRLIDGAIILNSLNASYYFDSAKILLNGLEEEYISTLFNKDQSEILNDIHKRIHKAIMLEPLNSEFHLNLGYLYSLINNDEKAQQEFRKAYLLDSRNINNMVYIIKYFLNKKMLYEVNYYLEKAKVICKDISFSFDACREILQMKENIP